MSQVNVIVIHVRAEQAAAYEHLFKRRELPRWKEDNTRKKFVSARFSARSLGRTSLGGLHHPYRRAA